MNVRNKLSCKANAKNEMISGSEMAAVATGCGLASEQISELKSVAGRGLTLAQENLQA